MTFIGRRSLRAAVAGALLATGFVLGSATAHAAAEDPRATRHEGNASTCADAGLAGSILSSPGDYTYARGEIDDNEQYVDILTVAPDITVTGIVVKGGNAYNVYEPGKLGLAATPPWLDLRAPVTGENDNIPALSHWFVCGTEQTTTTTTTTATSTSATSTTTTTASSSTSSSTVSTTPSESSAGTTSSSPAGGGAVATTSGGPKTTAQNASELAYTGFNGGWLIGLGAALVLGGAALMFVVRARRKA